jgi:hypothetical protein
MDLNFVTGNNAALNAKLDEFGCDLDSLLYIAKDFFGLCDEIGLNPRQTADVFIRLKNAFDASQGKEPSPDLVVYENSRAHPTKLCVENKTTGQSILFKIVPGQGKTEKKLVLFKCDVCNGEENIKRIDVKDHVLDKHVNI